MKLKGISENGLKRIASKVKGQDATQQIVQYLTENGDMSGQDIINDLGLSEADVDMAEQAGLIQQVQPLSGGGGAWYRAASRRRAQEDLPDEAWDMGGDPGDDRDENWMPDAEDLVLYIDNTYELYGQKQSIQKNLIRKLNKGTYDAALAPKLWGYLVQEGAKRYVSEMGESFPGMPWHKVFPTQVRQEAAQEMASNFEAEVDFAEGDLNEHFGV